MSKIDDAIDTALLRMEAGSDCQLVEFIVDNLVHVFEEQRAGSVARCEVAGYEVMRIDDKIAISWINGGIMDSTQARMLATALLRAAEAADA